MPRFNYFCAMFKCFLASCIQWPGVYAILDPADNSATLSPLLLRFMKHLVADAGKARVFCFKTGSRYGFTDRIPEQDSAATARLQLNTKFRCVGFQMLCPTVARILFDYGLPHDRPVRMRVRVHRKPFTWYELKP